jgi:hypothetical protein
LLAILIDRVFRTSSAERCLIRTGSMAVQMSAMCANDAGLLVAPHAGIPPRTGVAGLAWPALCATLTFAT